MEPLPRIGPCSWIRRDTTEARIGFELAAYTVQFLMDLRPVPDSLVDIRERRAK